MMLASRRPSPVSTNPSHHVADAGAHVASHARPLRTTAGGSGGSPGPAGADERVDRRAHQEGVAERRADPRQQLRPARRGRRGDTNVVVGRQRSVGSGFVIDADGYIMTNAHVVSGAQRVQVVLPSDNADGTLATALSGKTYLVAARIVGVTTELDLALLKVDGMKLPALPLAHLLGGPPGRDGVRVRQPERDCATA